MPHFENLEKYESRDEETGSSRILPIAPHSSSPTEFRPNHNHRKEVARRPLEKPLPSVEIEPVSIKQMEKAFRQASREAGDTFGPIPVRTLRRKFRQWMRGLRKLLGISQPKRKKVASSRKSGNQPSTKESPTSNPRSGKSPHSKGDNQRRKPRSENSGKNRNPSRSPRKSASKPQGENRRPQGDKSKSPHPQGSDKNSGSNSPPRRRNRRNRNRSRNSGGRPKGSDGSNPNSSGNSN